MEACFSGIRVVKAYVREAAQQGKFRVAAEDRRAAEVASEELKGFVESTSIKMTEKRWSKKIFNWEKNIFPLKS